MTYTEDQIMDMQSVAPPEDNEEFFARLALGPGNAHLSLRRYKNIAWRDEAKTPIIDRVVQARDGLYDGRISVTEYNWIVDEATQQMLQITGPVKATTEFVGYF